MRKLIAIIWLVAGCHAASDDAPARAAIEAPRAEVSVRAAVRDDGLEALAGQRGDRIGTLNAACPFGWTCDEVHWYSTAASCNASCGSTCVRMANCNAVPNCICP